MADRPFEHPLPADLPEDWTSGQTIAPAGADVGLSKQHGYNYLMEQVNAAQRAANAINESFDSISGKRTCRFVVGTSTAGWTEADCDYLCDGTNDQEEIQAAFNALPSEGGEIVLLDGTYQIENSISLSMYESETKRSVVMRGNGAATRLVAEQESIRWDGSVDALGSVLIRDLNLDGVYVSTEGTNTRISHCVFQNASCSASSLTLQSGSIHVEIVGNIFEVEESFSGGVISVIDFFNDAKCNALIRNNQIHLSNAQDPNSMGIQTSGGGVAVISENHIDGPFYIGIQSSTSFATISGNSLTGCRITTDRRAAILGNYVTNGDIFCGEYARSESETPSIISGNVIRNGYLLMIDWTMATGNTITAPDSAACIVAQKGDNHTVENLSAVVSENICSGGTIGVYLSDKDLYSPSMKNALITGNRCIGQSSAAIQIDSNWSGCMVTENMIDGPILDKGTNNIIRLNSDDPGGGSSGGTAGVSSFKGRSGAVYPQTGDYTAEMVGAIPTSSVAAIQALTQAEYDALAVKDEATLYLIKE